jgi:hypothetical protein
MVFALLRKDHCVDAPACFFFFGFGFGFSLVLGSSIETAAASVYVATTLSPAVNDSNTVKSRT